MEAEEEEEEDILSLRYIKRVWAVMNPESINQK